MIIPDSLCAIVLVNSNCKFHYRGMRLMFPSTTRTVSREEITSAVLLSTTVKMIPLNGSILWLPSIPSYCNMHEPLETVISLLESFDCILLINENRDQLNSLDCSELNFITGQILHKTLWAFHHHQTQIKK